MKHPWKQLTALLLTMALTMGLAVAQVRAVNTPEEEGFTSTGTYINPIYQDVVTEEDLTAPKEESPSLFNTVTYYSSQADAAAAVRAQAKKRETEIQIGYKTKTDPHTTNPAVPILKEAMEKHTRVPTEGDYLCFQYKGLYYGMKTELRSDGYYYLSIIYTLSYYTSADQEDQMNQAVKDLRKNLKLSSQKSQLQKFLTIYNYICAKVTYDKTHMYDMEYYLKYTGYAALKKKTAVCQGYAVLLYRLLMEEGIDCRIIGGTAANTSTDTQSGANNGHAWNIVRIGPKYYNVDATWDAELYQYGYKPRFCLCSESSFENSQPSRHVRDNAYRTADFLKQFPMSSTDMSDETVSSLEKKHAAGHTWMKWNTTPATYTKAGGNNFVCTICGERYNDNGVPRRNSITASNITTTSSATARTVSLKAKAQNGTLSYKSSVKKVKVSTAGKVTIPKNYVGRATITITAKGSNCQPATRQVTVTVKPKGVKLSSLKNKKGKKLLVKWQKNTTGSSYQLQYSTSKKFQSGTHSVSVKKSGTTSKTLTGLTKGKTYYVRIRTWKNVSGTRLNSSWSGSKKLKITK